MPHAFDALEITDHRRRNWRSSIRGHAGRFAETRIAGVWTNRCALPSPSPAGSRKGEHGIDRVPRRPFGPKSAATSASCLGASTQRQKLVALRGVSVHACATALNCAMRTVGPTRSSPPWASPHWLSPWIAACARRSLPFHHSAERNHARDDVAIVRDNPPGATIGLNDLHGIWLTDWSS